MTAWTKKIEERVISIENNFKETEASLQALKNSLNQTKVDCESAISNLNEEKDGIPDMVEEIVNPVLDEAKNKFQNLENSSSHDIQNHIDSKLAEVDTLIKAQKLNVGREISELKDSYKGVKESKIREATDLLKKLKITIEEKEKQISQLLKEAGLAKDAITQEALSRKNFDLADDKEKKANQAEKSLRFTLIAITILFVISFYKIIFTDNGSLTEAEILFRITLATPLGIYAYIQSKKVDRESKLRDQYHHKGVSLASYSGFITRIEEDESIPNDKKIHLLETTFEQVLDNAVDKTDDYEIKKLKLMQKVSTNVLKICNKTKDDTGKTIDNLLRIFGVEKINHKTNQIQGSKNE